MGFGTRDFHLPGNFGFLDRYFHKNNLSFRIIKSSFNIPLKSNNVKSVPQNPEFSEKNAIFGELHGNSAGNGPYVSMQAE